MPYDRLGIKLKVVAIEDSPQYEINQQEIKECFEFIRDAQLKQGKTVVVCTAGVSRSATICIAYLMKYEKMTMQQAFIKVKRARRFIKPNPGFVTFL